MRFPATRPLPAALILALGLTVASCGTIADNRSVYSVHQPVVERTSMALDVATSPDGLPVAEQRRVAAWFEAMDLRYGDRVAIEDPLERPETRSAFADLVGRHGLLLAESPPVISGSLQPGQARVVIQRSRASVPGCPNWSATSDFTLGNGLGSNYGCASNSNLAAMVADPEDLIKGRQGSEDTYINTSNTTIKTYSTTVGTKVNVAEGGGPGGN